MGQLITVKCLECDYNAIFATGTGFLDASLNAVAARFPENVAKHILYIAQNFQVDNYQYEKKLAFCAACRSLKSVPVISVAYNKKSQFNYGFFCEECGGDYEFTPLSEICDKSCPKCNTSSLYNCGIGLWD